MLRKKGVMQLIFYIQISVKACYKLILRFFDGDSQAFPNPKIASLQCLYNITKREVRNKVDFLDADKHQRFLQLDCNTLGIKASCKVILSLLMDMIKHSQSTQSNKFGISLQYLKKEVRNGAHFLHADKYQNFYKLDYRF